MRFHMDRHSGRFRRTATGMLVAVLLAWTPHAMADVIVLVTGDRLTGEIVERTETHVVLLHPILGRLEIPVDQIVRPPASERTAQTAEAAKTAAAAPVREAAETPAEPEAAPDETKEEKEWKSTFELAGTGKFGESDEQSVTVAVTSERAKELTITRLDMRYYYDATNGDRSDNKLTAGVMKRWLRPQSPWSTWASGRYDYDEFNSWEYRFGVHAGVAYDLVKKDDFTLIAFGGGGVVKEFNSQDEPLIPEPVIGFNLDWKISDKQQFKTDHTIFINMDETGEFRVVSSAEWSYLINEDMNLRLTAGLNNEYDSNADPDIDKNDLRVRVGLRFDF